MKKILMMGDGPSEIIPDIDVEVQYFNPYRFITRKRVTPEFLSMSNIDNLWRSGDKELNQLLEFTKKLCEDKDALIVNWVNFFPPEWIYASFSGLRKYFACMDDPHKAYERTLNSIWAYDGVIYWSLDYDEQHSSEDILKVWGAKKTHWWPASWIRYDAGLKEEVSKAGRRRNGIVYVGSYYGDKLNRIASFREQFKNEFSVYGRWPLDGFVGYFAPIRGRKFFPYRVKTLTDEERTKIYLNTKICFDMHLSSYPREIGNMRMYESTLHGMLLLCDKGSSNNYSKIFKPNEEAVFYDNIDDAIELGNYFLRNDLERERIASAGFNRAWESYNPEKVLRDLITWALN